MSTISSKTLLRNRPTYSVANADDRRARSRLPFVTVIASALTLFSPVLAAPKTKFCASLDETTASSSLDCVRWYFACHMGAPSPNPEPPYDQLPYPERARLRATATFLVAETTCKHFSYAEAWSALQAHMQDPPEPSR